MRICVPLIGGQLEQARQVLQKGLGPTSNYYEIAIELADLDIEPFRRNLALTEDKLRTAPPEERRSPASSSPIAKIDCSASTPASKAATNLKAERRP